MPPKPVPRTRKYVPFSSNASRIKQMTSAVKIQRAVRQYMNKKIETKHACTSTTDYRQIGHNSFINLDNLVLYTSQGVDDPSTSSSACRIGDEIDCRGIAYKIMVELNERYSDVTYRIFLVKSAKGDTPTATTLFNGLSGNKMIDTLNTERYTILYSKTGKIRSPNIASNGVASGGALAGAGTYDMLNGQQTILSRATKIIKFWVPGKKLVKNGKVQYENAQSGQVKFYDYNLVIYAYSNYSTSSALGFNVLAVNDFVKVIYFKDA